MKCDTVVIIGASTGGPQTLRRLISRLPTLEACVLIVLHMPKHVNWSIRKSISDSTRMDVRLAEDGMEMENGVILIAPSEVHMVIENNRYIRLVEGPKVNFVCPSIDVTMQSVQPEPPIKVIGVILTGMGSDGAGGIAHVRDIGGVTIAQDEETSTVYGMPRAAADTGRLDYILPPEMIGDKIAELTGRHHALASGPAADAD